MGLYSCGELIFVAIFATTLDTNQILACICIVQLTVHIKYQYGFFTGQHHHRVLILVCRTHNLITIGIYSSHGAGSHA